jgi:hypothetical protein
MFLRVTAASILFQFDHDDRLRGDSDSELRAGVSDPREGSGLNRRRLVERVHRIHSGAVSTERVIDFNDNRYYGSVTMTRWMW